MFDTLNHILKTQIILHLFSAQFQKYISSRIDVYTGNLQKKKKKKKKQKKKNTAFNPFLTRKDRKDKKKKIQKT